jgi:hypothetical protein
MVDLFGEVAVSLREIQLWLYKVPRMPHGSTRRDWYVRGWNVVSKIKRAKLRGELADVFGDECCDFCGQRLCDEVAPLSPGVPEIELALLRRRVAVLELVLAAVAHEKGAHSGRLTRIRESSTSAS